jgi:hypothetical protein
MTEVAVARLISVSSIPTVQALDGDEGLHLAAPQQQSDIAALLELASSLLNCSTS